MGKTRLCLIDKEMAELTRQDVRGAWHFEMPFAKLPTSPEQRSARKITGIPSDREEIFGVIYEQSTQGKETQMSKYKERRIIRTEHEYVETKKKGMYINVHFKTPLPPMPFLIPYYLDSPPEREKKRT